ncbi:MAG: M1 family aminopeptidase [Planctomycetota bacterium]
MRSTRRTERMNQHLQKGSLIYLERVTMLPDIPIAECWQTHPAYFAVAYMKGATILATLRREVGDEAFFRALKRYASDYAFREGGISDFRKIFEEESGKNLKGFFMQWVHSPGFPHLRIESVALSEAEGGHRAEVKVVQKQSPPFSIALDVAFHGEGEKKVVRPVQLEENEETIEETLPFRPVRIVLDPDNRILKHPGEDNVWGKK